MAKSSKAAKSTKRRTKVDKLSAGEKELTAAEKKKVKGGLSLDFEEAKVAKGNTIGGAFGSEVQNTAAVTVSTEVLRPK